MSDKARNILFAESGSTKTDWVYLSSNHEIMRFKTAGVNPAVMSAEEVMAVVLTAVDQLPEDNSKVDEIRFYGAGLLAGEAMILLNKVLKVVFPNASAVYGSDLLAAALAAFGEGQGIIAIMGTGSNTGFYDGRNVKSLARSGGYVLGDEGSGNALGKALLADYIKGLLPEDIQLDFEREYGLSYESIVAKLYKGGNPAAFLASFAPFVLGHRGNEYVDALIDSNLRSFIERSLLKYDTGGYEIALVGSLACELEHELRVLAAEYGILLTKFIRKPIDEIVRNHV